MKLGWTWLLLLSACGRDPSSESPAIFLAERLDQADRSAASASLSEFRSVSWTLAEETRLSVVSPLASRISFSLLLPDEPVLKFAIALAPLTNVDSTDWATLRSADFRVDVESGGARETLFTAPVRRHEAGTWIDHTLDLARFAGQSVRLVLETTTPDRFLRDPSHLRAAREQYLALWGNPVLESRRARADGNVILISLDCVRADHIGAYGYEEAKTPRIDAFAREGVRFETAVTAAPSTLPSHTSIFTGLTPLVHGANKWRPRRAGVPYLPDVLARMGFEVNGVVAGPYLSQTFGFEQGFHSYKFLFDARAGDVIDSVLEVLSRASGRRQFLFVHLFDAHAPYLAPREFLPRTGAARVDISSLMKRTANGRVPTEEDRRGLMALYDAEIAYVDGQVGRLLDELQSRGLYDSSLIIITADHGEAFYEHGHWQHSRSLYEELIHVPLVVKWPGESEASTVEGPVSLIDIFPTILDEAGASGELRSMGVDLRQTASGAHPAERKVISEFEWLLEEETVMKISLRGDVLKYIATLESAPSDEMALRHVKSEELYSLAEDPGERHNLVEKRTDSRDAFRELLSNYLKTVFAARRAGEDRIELDETTRKRLESLGYVYR